MSDTLLTQIDELIAKVEANKHEINQGHEQLSWKLHAYNKEHLLDRLYKIRAKAEEIKGQI